MKKFADYYQERSNVELARLFVALDIDAKEWAQHVIDVTTQYNLTEAQLLGELGVMPYGTGGLTNVAAGALGGAVNGVGGALKSGWDKLKGWAGPKIQQGMQSAGQLFNQGENQAAVNNALKYIDTLKKHLVNTKIVPDENTANQYLGQLQAQLQGLAQQISQQQGADRSQKFGNGINQVNYQSNPTVGGSGVSGGTAGGTGI